MTKTKYMMEKESTLSDVEFFLLKPTDRELIRTNYINGEMTLQTFLLRKKVSTKCDPKWLEGYAQDPEFLNEYYFPILVYNLKNPSRDEDGNTLPNRQWKMSHHVNNDFDIEYGDFDPENVVKPHIKKFKVSRTLYRAKTKYQIDIETLQEYVRPDRKSSHLLLYKEMKIYHKRFVDIEDEFTTGQVLWAFGTWVHRCFDSFPYLFYRAFTGSGKTRAMKTQACLCRRPWMVTTPTLASLVRGIHANSPTLFVDEVEKYAEKESQEFINVLNSGFEKGSPVSKLNTDTHEIEEFDVFCPKALASTRDMPLTLMNRSLFMPLKKTLKSEKYSQDPNMAITNELTKELLFWSIDYGTDIYTKFINEDFSPIYQDLLKPIKNARLRNQAMKPIVTIADVLGIHNIEGELESLKKFINYQCEIAEEDTLDPLTLRVISVLYHLCPKGEKSDEFNVKKIKANMDLSDSEKKWITNQRIGYVLRGFHLKTRTVGGYKRYTVNRAILDEIAQRYNIDYGDVSDTVEDTESIEKKGLDNFAEEGTSE